MAWIGVITNAGAAILAQWAAGGHSMTIDRATVGAGVHSCGKYAYCYSASGGRLTLTEIVVEEVDSGDPISGSGVSGRVTVICCARGWHLGAHR